MKVTQSPHNLGQSIWLDNIKRQLLDSGTLKRYIDDLSVTGLISNPTIFDHAITHSKSYDSEIRRLVDIDLWVNHCSSSWRCRTWCAPLICSLQSTNPPQASMASFRWKSRRFLRTKRRRRLSRPSLFYKKANRRNLFIKIPGTKEGALAIEEAIFSGVPVNVTLLFSRDHYVAAAEAYMRGLKRRITAGLSPDVRSVGSPFIIRWDKATMDKVTDKDRDKLGVAIGQRSYKAYRDVLESDRWLRLANSGARAQRLLFASTGSKDPKASDVSYIGALAAPNTVNTMPEETLRAFGQQGQVSGVIPRDGGDCEQVLAEFGKIGVDVAKLGADLQTDGAKSFVDSWKDLMGSKPRAKR